MKTVVRSKLVLAFLLCLVALNPGKPDIAAQADTPPPYTLYLPVVRWDGPANTVNLLDRQAALDFYQNVYLTSSGTANWTGSQAGCNPGTTDANYRLAILQRINYFRAMAGVPASVIFSEESNRLAQAAALMMSANNSLSHSPPTNWLCYSADGAAGAGSSNLARGVSGWDAISLYMKDSGANNSFVGHRRWILYPQTSVMGTGDVPGGGGYSYTNALRVFDSHTWDPRPATRDEYVAWPPPGYVPYPIVFARWSFSFDNADFSSATVEMNSGGSAWPVSLVAPVDGYGENTLVWIPNGMSDFASWPKPGSDTTITVSVQDVVINSVKRDFTYQVIVFDPGP